MSNNFSRKMGFLEKFSSLNNDRMAGTTNCNAILKINTTLDFSLFKQAWEILFQRQPMLRITRRIEQEDLFFDFNADFNNIPIQFIETNDFAVVEQEYSREIVKPYDLSRYYWKTTLANMPNNSCSYIILGISHANSDGLSISWLLGDLLRLMLEIGSSQKPSTASLPIPLALDTLLDRTQFKTPQLESIPTSLVEAVSFHQPATITSARSENVFRLLSPATQQQFLNNCRQHQTTVTSMLCAALALSLHKLGYEKNDYMAMAVAFNLRNYLTQKIPDRLLAFYAHMSAFNLEIHSNQDIWSLSKQIKLKVQKALQEYTLPPNNSEIMTGVYRDWENSIANQKFYSTYCVSNLGVVDAAFAELDQHYSIESFYCSISQQALIFPLLLVAIGINHKLCLDFNFASPAFNKEAVEAIADSILYQLSLSPLYD